jgi:hypothetical protein
VPGYVTSARPVRVSNSGKVKRVKRKPNDLGTLSTVAGFVYPGGQKKLVKDATTDPYAKKKRKKAKAKNARPRKKRKHKAVVSAWNKAARTRKKNIAAKKRKAKANRKPAKRKTAKKSKNSRKPASQRKTKSKAKRSRR